MSFENDLERQMGDAGRKFEGWAEKTGQSLLKNWNYGIREIMAYKYLKKEEQPIKYGNLAIVLGIAGALFFYAPDLIKWVPIQVKSLGLKDELLFHILKLPVLYKAFAFVIPAVFLSAIGAKKFQEIQLYNDRFEMIGLSSGSKKTFTDGDGQKVRVMAFPELIRKIEVSEDMEIYLFRANGNSLDAFMKKRESLEQVFNTNIYKLDYTKGGKGVIQMATVSNQAKEKLMEQYEEQKKFNEKFERMGLIGKGYRTMKTFGGIEEQIKNYPEYLETTETTVNGKKVTTYSFKSEGTEIKDWNDKKYLIENVLDRIVVSIKQDLEKKQIYRLETISTKDDLRNLYDWKDEYIHEDDGILILGEGQLEKVKVDLNELPHMLIAGTTGSGKSVLTNCIAWQAIKKGWYIVPIDFKGGVELEMLAPFAPVLFEREKVIEMLDLLIKEHEARLEAFKKVGVKKLTQFNKAVGEEQALARIVLLIDEIAELLGKTSVKEIDAQIDIIEGKLNTLARLSRATGINIITATQRPDAKVLGGQIKNNLPIRVCGRMVDSQPSIMVLDSPDATRIPEEIKGRYMINTGSGIKSFQAYLFKEASIVPGDYRKGQLLVMEGDSGVPRQDIRSVVVLEKHGETKNSVAMNLIDDEGEDDDEDFNEEINPYDEIEDFQVHENDLEPGDSSGPTVVNKEILTIEDLVDPEDE